MSNHPSEVEEQLARILEQTVELLNALRPWENLTAGQREHAVKLTLALATLAATEDADGAPDLSRL